MSNYRVDVEGKNFQVIETRPDDAVGFTGGFHSEKDARQWIGDLVRCRRETKSMLCEDSRATDRPRNRTHHRRIVVLAAHVSEHNANVCRESTRDRPTEEAIRSGARNQSESARVLRSRK